MEPTLPLRQWEELGRDIVNSKLLCSGERASLEHPEDEDGSAQCSECPVPPGQQCWEKVMGQCLQPPCENWGRGEVCSRGTSATHIINRNYPLNGKVVAPSTPAV